MAIIALILVAAVTLLACFYFYRKFHAHQLFVREGIPGPKPHWLFGNVKEFADETVRHLVLPNWTKRYGKIFGYYEGSKPTLVTSDPDLVMQVFVKQFPSFHARKRFPIQPDPESPTDDISMFLAIGDRWKRLRTIVNPTFSATKMRALMPLMTKCQDDFMHLINEKGGNGQAFDIFECFKLLTLDTISETALGIELNSARTNDNENPVMAAVNAMINTTFKTPWSVKIATFLPEAAPALSFAEVVRGHLLGSGLKKGRFILQKMVSEIIESRKKANKISQTRQDLLQMMIDLEESPDKIQGLKALSNVEIIGEAILFLVAGFETSSNALAFCCFLLAKHPDIQDKLIAEIDEQFPATSERLVTYDSVYELPYLAAVINETLRLYPIAVMVVNRMSTEDTVVNGIRIPQGLPITADVWSMHRDEEQWGPVDPEAFHPERFLDDYPTKQSRHDAAFIPFGFGPRTCIGMRFALMEIKLTLVNILRKYRIEKSSRTGDKLKMKTGFSMTPLDGVWIKLQKRK